MLTYHIKNKKRVNNWSTLVRLPEKITISETLQMAVSESSQLILIIACQLNVMHVEQRILHQRNTPQGNFIILPTEVANLQTETSSGVRTPTPFLSAGPSCEILFLLFHKEDRQSRAVDKKFPSRVINCSINTLTNHVQARIHFRSYT